MAKKVYYRIGEVAELLDIPISKVRYWSDTFDELIKVRRNTKGDRFFVYDDVEVFKKILYLTKDCGYTLNGARDKLMAEKYVQRVVKDNKKSPESEVKLDCATQAEVDDIAVRANLVMRLTNIRTSLEDIMKFL